MSEEIILDDYKNNQIVPASKWKRFGNLIIDLIANYLLGIIIGVFIGSSELSGDAITANIIGYAVALTYYFVMEFTTGRTIGKMITGTRVVKETGENIDVKDAFLRTLCRIIPFEALSFLGASGVGLHDSLSKTRVVNG